MAAEIPLSGGRYVLHLSGHSTEEEPGKVIAETMTFDISMPNAADFRRRNPVVSNISREDVVRLRAALGAWLTQTGDTPEQADAGVSSRTLDPRRVCGQREPGCASAWPDAHSGDFNPSCCRFPKSCSVNRCTRPDDHNGDHVDETVPEGHASRSWNDQDEYTGLATNQEGA